LFREHGLWAINELWRPDKADEPMQEIFEQFVTLWVVIDPIGTIPVFVAVTAGIEAKKRTGVAIHAAVLAICVLMFFLVAGQFLIDALGIGLPAFQIAGGLILFLFALTMIFGDSKPKQEIGKADADEKPESPAVFPLAVPSLASPGAMLAVVLLTDNNRFSFAEQADTGCGGGRCTCSHAAGHADPEGHRYQRGRHRQPGHGNDPGSGRGRQCHCCGAGADQNQHRLKSVLPEQNRPPAKYRRPSRRLAFPSFKQWQPWSMRGPPMPQPHPGRIWCRSAPVRSTACC
jgi:multiple antibiotic resistance protein